MSYREIKEKFDGLVEAKRQELIAFMMEFLRTHEMQYGSLIYELNDQDHFSDPLFQVLGLTADEYEELSCGCNGDECMWQLWIEAAQNIERDDFVDVLVDARDHGI